MPSATRARLGSILQACLIWMLCSCPPAAAEDGSPLFAVPNDRFGLTVEFFGEWVGPDADPESQFLVERIVLRDVRSASRAEYGIDDPSSPDSALGFYRDVWSPDGEFLALPRGRYGGFSLFASGKAVDEMRQSRPADTIAIEYEAKSDSVWHDFAGWSEGHVLLFNVEMGTTSVRLAYDPVAHRISSPGRPIEALSAQTGTSALQVIWNSP